MSADCNCESIHHGDVLFEFVKHDGSTLAFGLIKRSSDQGQLCMP